MSEEISIETSKIPVENNICLISSKLVTNNLFAKQKKMLPEELTTLEKESIKILCDCVPANFNEAIGKNNTILAFGFVQSGKTMSFETVTALARDNEYKLVVVIAGRTTILLNQTTKRLKDDLEIKAANGNFKIFKNPGINEEQQISNAIINPQKPTIIITVLKHQKYLNDLATLFSRQKLKTNYSNRGVIIIDDESDQASLNTFAKSNSKLDADDPDKFSAIYEGIKNLRETFANHSYIQYTATPQANLLIDYLNLLSPSSIHVLSPGLGYTGGGAFFRDNISVSTKLLYEHQVKHWNNILGSTLLYVREIPKGDMDEEGNYPKDERYHPNRNDLDSAPPSLKEALRQFLIGSVITVKLDKCEDFVSMLVHPTHIVHSHKKFKLWINSILEQWQIDYQEINDGKIETNDFRNKMLKSYNDFVSTNNTQFTFDEIWNNMFEIITNYKIHLVIGDEVDITDDDWEEHLCHILIGGNKLDRGFTVKNLISTYMPRYSVGKSNADTIQQRCRFFGYKKGYLKACRVFLPGDSIDEYADYVEDEEMLRNYFKQYSLKDFFEGNHSMHLTPRLNATRQNIISSKIISNQYKGYKYFQPFGNFEHNNLLTREFLSSLSPAGVIEYGSTKHDVYIVDLELVFSNLIEKFKFIYPEDDIKVRNTSLIMELAKKTKKTKVFILNMAQGEARERGVKEFKFADDEVDGISSKVFRINLFHQGPNNNYPGDGNLLRVNDGFKTKFGYNDDFIVQLHNFRPKQFFDKDFYSMAIYYPESLTANYIALTY